MRTFRQPFVGGVPLGAPGALASYWLSSTEEVERDLERLAPMVAPFIHAARSRPSRPTRHRLVRLIEAAEDDLLAHQSGGGGSHLVDVVELGHVVDLIEEWRRDPAGHEVLRDLRSPGVYAHDVLVLAAARMFRRSWRNEVVLLKRSPARTADLAVETPAGRVAIELKAPHELDGHDEERTKGPGRVAEDVLRRSSKQRRTAPASFLVVAGYRVPDEPREALIAHLLTRLRTRPQVAGVAVLSIGRHPSEDAAVADAFLGKQWPRAFTPQQTTALLSLVVAANVARNPAYRGPVPVVGLDGENGLRLPRESGTVRWHSDGRAERIE